MTPAATDAPAAILGFRQDRVGARIVGLLNVLRLGRSFGVPARFGWLAAADGAYPELADPAQFLDPAFVAAHLTLLPRPPDGPPDPAGWRNLTTEAPRMDRATFAAALAGGARFLSDAAFEPVRLMDEPASDLRAELAAIAAALPLNPQLAAALDRARGRLAALAAADGAVPAAIHLRRGDILDVPPWCLTSWASKYVPDEYYSAFLDAQPGRVIGFSDTPGAVRHLDGGRGRVLAAADLLAGEPLSPAQSDLAELLLMAGLAVIAAPQASAFSRAAQMVGSARIVVLPADLPPGARQAASESLLQRVLTRPGSFLAPGDLAQSLRYAAGHATATGRGGAFLSAFAGNEALMAAHPFVRRLLAETAEAAGDPTAARGFANAALADPQTLRRDRLACRDVLLLADAAAPDFDRDSALLAEGFRPGGPGRAAAMLAARVLVADGPAARALMVAPPVMAALADAAAGAAGAAGAGLPPWCYLIDWLDLMPGEAARRPVLSGADPGTMLRLADPSGAATEALVEAGAHPAAPAGEVRARLGLYAAALSLHGRLRRALRLLHWLDRCGPGDALVLKRLSDTCQRAGRPDLARDFLDKALAAAPGNVLLHLSDARQRGQRAAALAALARAEAAWPGLPLIAQQHRLIRRGLMRSPGEDATRRDAGRRGVRT